MAEDPRSAELIKPILRGEDVKAYVPQWAGLWLITTFPALRLPIDDYPAVKKYLSSYRNVLEPKPRHFADKWEGRKSGSYKWFETQDSITYHEDFLKPKIIYPNMTKFLPFVYDKDRFFTNDKSFILTGDWLNYLTAFLNSKLFKFAFKEYFPELLGESREVRKVFFETVPVKSISDESWYEKTLKLIADAKKGGQSTSTLEAEIDERLFELYGLSQEDRAMIKATFTA